MASAGYTPRPVITDLHRSADAIMGLFEEFISDLPMERYASLRICVEGELRKIAPQEAP